MKEMKPLKDTGKRPTCMRVMVDPEVLYRLKQLKKQDKHMTANKILRKALGMLPHLVRPGRPRKDGGKKAGK